MSGILRAVLGSPAPPAVHGSAAFNSAGSWTVPAGVTSVTLEAIGAGANGGSGHAYGGGGGGQSGTGGTGTGGLIVITY